MNFNRLQYLLAALSALLLQSTIVPAQRVLPQLPTDSRIQQGTLGCGASYYMVTDPVQKGYAQIALVQKGDSLTSSKEVSPSFLSRMGVAPGPQGYLSQQDGSTVYRFHDVRCYNPEVLDSVLLYTFEKMAACRAPQAVIVSGDIDAVELKKKMDIFSLLVSRLPESPESAPYQWKTRIAPQVRYSTEGTAYVSAAYTCPRIPPEDMNTAQALVTDLFSLEFKLLLGHRLELNLRDAGIPYGSIDFISRRSVDSSCDEQYAVQVSVAPEDLENTLTVLSRTIAEIDYHGVGVEEFTEAKQVLLPSMQRKAAQMPSGRDYLTRCVAHYLYGAQLAPYSEPLRFFARKRVSDSTETRLFNQYADALLGLLENLTLGYGPVQPDDTTDVEGDILVRYFMGYLEGRDTPSGKDYRWHAADTAGLEFSCPKVRIKTERAEPVSGGTVWTFTNGIRVIYKQVKGSGRFNYALQLNGGLSQIGSLKEGEGAYIGQLLNLYDVAGISAPWFSGILAANGVHMSTQVNLNSMAVVGDAPSDQLSLVLKSLLGVANHRSFNRGAYDYFCRQQALVPLSAEDALALQMTPGYLYTGSPRPEALSAETPKKAGKFFEDRFARVNDGTLILCGDLSPEAAKRHLQHYLGGFRTLRGSVPRKTVEMRTLSGTSTVEMPGPAFHVMMDAEYAMTASHLYTAQIGLEALKLALIRHLADDGFLSEVQLSYVVQPQERFRILITCTPFADDASSSRALTAVRAALREVAKELVDEADLKAWKDGLKAGVRSAMVTPEPFVSSLLARYAANKDVLTYYDETISAITGDQVREFLRAMISGGRIETVRP